MSGPVIIRLQNLPLEARSIDIRKFFEGLIIPDGGVHIIGGERGDAFIAFQSDEDARQAMARDGNFLCNAKIKLFLSSKNEMQNVITAARNQLQQLQVPPTTTSPIDKILSKTPSQQNPLDLLNSITKLFSKPEPVKPEPTPPSTNISINEILNILKTTNQKPTQQAEVPAKPSLLPTPTPSTTVAGQEKNAKRKFDERPADSKPKIPLLSTPNTAPRALEPVIRVKNFSPNCSYKDIRTFLQGIQIEHNGIKFITEANGQGHKGQAYVKLVNIVDLKKALCRNGQFYEENQIEVFQSSESELNAGQSMKKMDAKIDASAGFYVKIYGLPARFDDTLLRNMFNNVKFVRIITSNPTAIQSKVINQDGLQETKTVIKAKKLCEVETQLDVERALTRQDERVGKSKIQIFQISKSEFERELSTIKNLDEEMDEGSIDNGGIEDEDEEFYALLSGAPFSVRLDDVRGFFSGIGLKEISNLVGESDGKPTGEWIMEFYTKSDRDKALSKSDSLFRNRAVKVKAIGTNEYKKLSTQVNKQKKAPLIGTKPALLATPVSPSEKPKLINEFEEQGYKRSHAQSGYGSNKRVKQSSPVHIDLPPLPAELQKYKNSIVLLSNVSYEATREDILELFKYYSPIEQTLKIRHDDRGQPTGDAIVACKSHDEASKACKSLNGVDFMGRSIRAVLINP